MDHEPNARLAGPQVLAPGAVGQVGGGEQLAPTDSVTDFTPLYDALVDAASQLIEKVMVATKSF